MMDQPVIQPDQRTRRQLLKALAALPLMSFIPAVNAVSTGDVDAEIADFFWSQYLKGSKDLPRHDNTQCQDALTAIAKPIMRSSTRKGLDWRIGLLSLEPANAFTPGGGVIYVHDSLIRMCESEAELAAVIAHEVGHIEHRHAIQRHYSSAIFKEMGIDASWDRRRVQRAFEGRAYDLVAQKIIFKSYRRLWEHQADAFIIKAFRDTGYSLADSYVFFERMQTVYGDRQKGLCIYDSHPLNQERIARLKKISKAYGGKATRGDSEAFRFLKTALG